MISIVRSLLPRTSSKKISYFLSIFKKKSKFLITIICKNDLLKVVKVIDSH